MCARRGDPGERSAVAVLAAGWLLFLVALTPPLSQHAAAAEGWQPS
jgi:hypothetical protein